MLGLGHWAEAGPTLGSQASCKEKAEPAGCPRPWTTQPRAPRSQDADKCFLLIQSLLWDSEDDTQTEVSVRGQAL